MNYQGRYKLSLHEEKAAITTHFLRHYPCCLLLNAKTESNICPPRLHCTARVLVGHTVEEREIVKVRGFYTSSLLTTLMQCKETYRSCKRLLVKGLRGAYLFFLQS